MPDYRRYRVPGGTYFTINLLERRADLLVRHIEPLREAVVHASRSTVPYRCLGRASRSHALRDYPTTGR